MKIKTKLTLGVGLLFILIIVLSLLGARKIYNLKNETNNILRDNYITLEYTRNMLLALDEMGEDSSSVKAFEANLAKQMDNATEPGEEDLNESLSRHFALLKNHPSDSMAEQKIRHDLNDIMKLNMLAISQKSEFASKTAENAIFWISITGTICFLIAFVLLVNLPGNIANPISQLTESIRQIAAKNYSQRVNFQDHNEFGELAESFNTMAEKLEEYNNSNLANLLTQKKRVETLINNMHDPVILLDENNKVVLVNDEAVKVSGLKKEDLLGKTARELSVTNDLLRSLTRDMMQNTEKNYRPEALKIYANGKESYFEKEILEISATPAGETIEKTIGHVFILRNVTSYKELDFAKTNFIATVSHELKTPISSIMMSLDLLENEKIGNVNAEQKQLINSVKEDSQRLLKITRELLNMTQVETGNIQLSIQQSDPVKIVDYALETVKTSAVQKQIIIKTEIENNLPLIKADEEKTAWVLINLLTNAIRYSPEKSTIIVTVNNHPSVISFSVKDFGKGIDDKYKYKIFNRYFQVPGSKKEGTGLGLAISKEFIEAQGGKIEVESEIGMGSKFLIVLNKA